MVVKNAKNELNPQHTITGWRMCIDYRKLNAATKKDHFHCPSSMRCWNDWRNTPIFVSSMGILVITKFPSIPMIKAKLRSHVHIERMHTEECRSGCAMHPPHSKDA